MQKCSKHKMSCAGFWCRFPSYVIGKYKVNICIARLVCFSDSRGIKCFLLHVHVWYIAPDSEQHVAKSSIFAAPIIFLCSPLWHCLLYFQTFLLLAPFMLIKTSFLFVPPYRHRADKDGSLAIQLENESVAKCENLFFICNWNRYFRSVLKLIFFFFFLR